MPALVLFLYIIHDTKGRVSTVEFILAERGVRTAKAGIQQIEGI